MEAPGPREIFSFSKPYFYRKEYFRAIFVENMQNESIIIPFKVNLSVVKFRGNDDKILKKPKVVMQSRFLICVSSKNER